MEVKDFKKFEQIEHVLAKPGMYIGDVRAISEKRWIINNNCMEEKVVTYVPALIHCVTELITNATDHVVRTLSSKNPVTKIEVNVDLGTNSIQIINDGLGIPTDLHSEYGVHIPELIFSQLLTTSNHNEDEKRIVGGTNGIGSKAVNVFAKEFKVETCRDGVLYKQVFMNNISVIGEPVIKKSKMKDFTSISWVPDMSRFGIENLSDTDTKLLIEKLVYDAAATTHKGVKVVYNGNRLSIKDFQDYISLYIGPKNEVPRLYYEMDRWSVGFALNPYNKATQVSFVNGINTNNGGNHVRHVLEPVVKELRDELIKKSKIVSIQNQHVRDNLLVFVNCSIENPTFNSQMKSELSTPIREFGSKCKFPKDMVSQIIKKLGIADSILSLAKAKESKTLQRTSGKKKIRLVGIPKLDDANKAGTKDSLKCTLILSEGDSAKSTVVSGLSEVGRDCYGVFPLKGKLLNVLKTDMDKISKNEEITNINQILGLVHGKDYSKDMKGLRYGKVMIATDADSVTGDTPLILRKDGMIEIKNIEDLFVCDPNIIGIEKEYCNSEYEVWSDKGWTKIKHVMKHKVSKQIYRVLTHTGCVDVTEDHSLLDKKGVEIAPKDCKVGDELLHSFPTFEDSNGLGNCSLSDEEAWVMGFVCADGYCSIGTDTWSISNCNLELLEKTRDIMKGIYGDLFKIYTVNNKHNLNLLKSNRFIVEKYRKLLYYKKYKYIHPDILNAKRSIRENFFNGYYAGDGSIDCNSKITTQCVFFLAKSLGYKVSINVFDNSLSIGDKHCRNPIRIKKIFPRTKNSQYVYDLETENHHFQAGVGEMIVHNTDGHHIKGLLINYFTHFWPELVTTNFLEALLTPVVKVFSPKKANDPICFYDINDYNKWKDKTPDYSKWRVKYYKGLGTSTSSEARDYFKNLKKNRLLYDFNSDRDTKQIIMAFGKDGSNDRKEWINRTLKSMEDKVELVNYKKKKLSVSSFVDGELAMFSVYNVARMIPNMIDGMKISQRKVLYGCLKRKLFLKANGAGEIKVAQLSGYISEHTSYHHGEASLQGTIVGMAQDFLGSGNCNPLFPSGQFGCRLALGKDCSSPRYIYTYLKPWVSVVFNEYDNEILNYLDDDGFKIEPDKYVPVVPMILLNGCVGIGTGWSSNIPCYEPSSVISNLRKLIEDEGSVLEPLSPWYVGFKGRIYQTDENRWISEGKMTLVSNRKVMVTELPVDYATDSFKELLDKLEQEEKIVSYVSSSTEVDINFVIEFDNLGFYTDEDLIKMLKLRKTISTSNMYAYSEDGLIRKYNNAEEILWDFYRYRLEFYKKRKSYLIEVLENKLYNFEEKYRFIMLVINDVIVIYRQKRVNIIESLRVNEFVERVEYPNYSNLIGLALTQFTEEKLEELESKINETKQELDLLKETSHKKMWLTDLDILIRYKSFQKQ